MTASNPIDFFPVSGGVVLMSSVAVVLRPYTLAPLRCRDGARRVFTHWGVFCVRGRGGGVKKMSHAMVEGVLLSSPNVSDRLELLN